MGRVGIMWPVLMNSREAAGELATVFDFAQTKQNRTHQFH